MAVSQHTLRTARADSSAGPLEPRRRPQRTRLKCLPGKQRKRPSAQWQCPHWGKHILGHHKLSHTQTHTRARHTASQAAQHAIHESHAAASSAIGGAHDPQPALRPDAKLKTHQTHRFYLHITLRHSHCTATQTQRSLGSSWPDASLDHHHVHSPPHSGRAA